MANHKLLSSIAAHHEIMVNEHNIAHILLSTGWVSRKVSSKYFSNYSIDTVRINNETYLIDSRIDVVLVESK